MSDEKKTTPTDIDAEQLEKLKLTDQPTIELTEEQEARFKLMRSVGEECLLDSELRKLIRDKKEQIICYDGFEPSGRIHIAQGIMKAINVNKLTKAGCKFIFLVADWFALMNNKMDGDLDKIKVVGEYLIEVWKATGMDLKNVEFVWSSEIINKESNRYWLMVLDIARKFNVPRIVRCSQIMGRENQQDLSSAQIFYPCMQCADIFFLKADICQLGMDQRKVNMLAREYVDEVKKDKKNKNPDRPRFKPIILSHHMLAGLTGEKMAKSDPKSAIFMDDSEKEVADKIKGAYCKEGDVEKNPPLEYIKYIILPSVGKFVVDKKDGPVEYTDFETIAQDWKDLKIHPSELKPSLTKAINSLLDPVRKHFEQNENARKLMELVKSYKVTK